MKFSPRNQAVAGAVVVIVAVIVAVVLMANRGDQLTASAKTVIINQMIISVPTLLGILFSLVKSSQAAEKAAETAEKADAMSNDLRNGMIGANVKTAITEMANDPDTRTVVFKNEDADDDAA